MLYSDFTAKGLALTDTNKLQSAVAYLAGKLQPGKVRLFKLMFLADFTARAELGHSISSDTYENFEMGPVPVTLWHQFDDILRDCVNLDLVETGGIPEQRLSAKPGFRPVLSDDDRAILDRIIARFGSWSGTRLKEYTHKTIPFVASERGETISYDLASYLNYQKPTVADLDRLLEDRDLLLALERAVRPF